MNNDDESIPLASARRELGRPAQLPWLLAKRCPLVVLRIHPKVIRLSVAEPSETTYRGIFVAIALRTVAIVSK